MSTFDYSFFVMQRMPLLQTIMTNNNKDKSHPPWSSNTNLLILLTSGAAIIYLLGPYLRIQFKSTTFDHFIRKLVSSVGTMTHQFLANDHINSAATAFKEFENQFDYAPTARRLLEELSTHSTMVRCIVEQAKKDKNEKELENELHERLLEQGIMTDD